MLRFLLWRLLGVLAFLLGVAAAAWLLSGGMGRVLRGGAPEVPRLAIGAGARALWHLPALAWDWTAPGSLHPLRLLAGLLLALCCVLLATRWGSRNGRRYVRLRVEGHRTDQAGAEALVRMFGALHQRLLLRWWRRLVRGQPGLALEVHYGAPRESGSEPAGSAWLALSCPVELVSMAEAALRTAYPNCRLGKIEPPGRPFGPAVLRLKKDGAFIRRAKVIDRFEHEREPPMNRLLTVMGACREPALVQLSLTPAPIVVERLARWRFKQREGHLSRERREHVVIHDRSMVEDAELRGGLDVQHQPLFFAEIRIAARERTTCERIASELRVATAENRLVERGTSLRHGLLGLYRRRLQRGEGNPLPGLRRGVFAARELAALWHMPSIDYLAVPFARAAAPVAPASPAIVRAPPGCGVLEDALGLVSIEPELRKQNTAVPGAVEQGKTSYLVATVAEDLRRDGCAVIVLDPKGDAADAALSLVPEGRTCTLLDFARPTCGFNPLAVDAPPDVIADYVVAAVKNLYADIDIKASSDRYLRNAIIAVLAHDRGSTLWDAARLLSVGEDGYAYRRAVAAHVRTLPELSEIATFFTTELSAQLADSRSMTTAKLDAPVNKLARLLNSASIKRVLLNDSLRVDFDRVIAGGEVLVVKGALGLMGAGNTSVLMQLLVGMLDAALARQQDLVAEGGRVAVALKVDEAPLVLNRGFAETMALKRSAGLETVACWQTDAQWTDRELRDQLDALFAHRVYFATASTGDARDSAGLAMTEFSDTIRPGIGRLSKLAQPDARLYLPKHHAIASWVTREGRQPPFLARTIRLRVDRERLAHHAARQRERGGRLQSDLRQPHWQRRRGSADRGPSKRPRERSAEVGDSPQRSRLAPGAGARPPVRDERRLAEREERRSAAGDVRGAPAPSLDGSLGLPDSPTASYRELVELDRAQSVRWARPAAVPSSLRPDATDLAMLELVARLGHVLSSQLHRRFNATRAVTTTQRRLKRLSDAGLVERLQLYGPDGGGAPMCYVLSAAGRALLSRLGPSEGACRLIDEEADRLGRGPRDRDHDHARLRRARRDVHLAGWVLALQVLAGDPRSRIRGRAESVLSPPRVGPGAGGARLGPARLRLPGGRVPHDFLRSEGPDRDVEIDHFETVRPDATLELPGRSLDLMVELEDRVGGRGSAALLRRYDHFLTGWSAHVPRYDERGRAMPLLVLVCSDRPRARRLAQEADRALLACRAYPGEYPQDWDYLGRSRILFASERDAHEGSALAYGVPQVPPAVRIELSGGDPSAGEPAVEVRDLLSAGDLAR